MTGPENALRAALEAAGLSLQAIPEEQRGMFTSLSDEEVTRLITLFGGQPALGGGRGGAESNSAPPDPTTAAEPGQPAPTEPGQPAAAPVDPDGLVAEDPANGAR